MQMFQNFCWNNSVRFRINTPPGKRFLTVTLVLVVYWFLLSLMYESETESASFTEVKTEIPATRFNDTGTVGDLQPVFRRRKHPPKRPGILLKSRKVRLQTEKPEPREPNPAEVKPLPTVESFYEAGFNISASSLCSVKGDNIKLLVLITTAPDYKEKRDTIRKTWGTVAERNDTALGFFMGMSSDSDTIAKINNESDTHGDIIRGNFMDTYNNLTLKTVSMLEWTLTYCNQTKMLFKVDDDMFVNFPKLFEILETRLPNTSRSILGHLAKGWKPIRNSESQYYLSTQDYPDTFLPDFSTGPAYIVTADAIGDLYKASLKGNFFKLEDVYVTGMIPPRLGIKNINVQEFYNARPPRITPCYAAKSVSIHMVQKEEMFSLWSNLSSGKLKC